MLVRLLLYIHRHKLFSSCSWSCLWSQPWVLEADSQRILKERASAWLIVACLAAYARMPSAMSGLTSRSLAPSSVHHTAFHSRKASTHRISSLTSRTSSCHRFARTLDFTHSHRRPIQMKINRMRRCYFIYSQPSSSSSVRGPHSGEETCPGP